MVSNALERRVNIEQTRKFLDNVWTARWKRNDRFWGNQV